MVEAKAEKPLITATCTVDKDGEPVVVIEGVGPRGTRVVFAGARGEPGAIMTVERLETARKAAAGKPANVKRVEEV